MDDLEFYAAFIDYLNTRDQEQRERKKHRLPIECYAASDCEFFFTLCARHLNQPFTNPDLARAVIEALLWRKRRHHWTLFCYCLMPDHLHLIVQLPSQQTRYLNAGARGIIPEGILDHVGNFKKYTTTQLWWKMGGTGQLWQQSSYDRAIRYNQSIEPAVHYIVNNPVRKGLVQDWREYPYAAIIDPWA
jgi:REP element-mobilizing transposase RayT